MKGAYRCSLTFLSFLCLLKVCELCFSVRASRSSRFVPEGGRLQLGCEVIHCGKPDWNGGWVFQEINSTTFIPLTPSERIELSNSSTTTNSTHLSVEIHIINQSDAGAYKCAIKWPDGITSSGHVTYVNVTAEENSTGRSHSHIIFPCLGVFMCVAVILVIFWIVSRDKPLPPPVTPHPRSSSAARVKPKKEVVYAEVALNNSRIQKNQPKQASESIVYSALQFS